MRFRNGLWVVVGMILLLTAMKPTVLAQADAKEKNRQAVQAAFDNWRRGAGTVFDLLASDAKWTIVGRSAASGTYQSRRDFMDQVIIPFNARLSTPLVPTVRGIYADGDMVIVLWLWLGGGVGREEEGAAGGYHEKAFFWVEKDEKKTKPGPPPLFCDHLCV